MAESKSTPVAVGQEIADFTLSDQDRNEWWLSDAVKRGDVVLCFFPFAFTGTCGVEMKCVTAELDSWRKRGSDVVGVSCDSWYTLKAWAKAEGFTHRLLSDQHRAVCTALGIAWPEVNSTRRATIVVGRNPEGRARVKWIQVREPANAMDWAEVMAHVG